MRLQYEVADLETQLESLQNMTNQVCESTASVGATFAWTKANVDQICDEIVQWKADEVDSLKLECDALSIQDCEGGSINLAIHIYVITLSCNVVRLLTECLNHNYSDSMASINTLLANLESIESNERNIRLSVDSKWREILSIRARTQQNFLDFQVN